MMTVDLIVNIFMWIYLSACVGFAALYVFDYAKNDSDPEDFSSPRKTYISCLYISAAASVGAWAVKDIYETSENFSPALVIIIELALLIFIILCLCRMLRLLRIVMEGGKTDENGQVKSQKMKRSLIYAKPANGRINPTDPDSKIFTEPDRCPLCCFTFDAGAELRIELKKDGYGDCSFCPKCGRKLS